MPVILANNFAPDHGGIQRYIERIANSLHEAGEDVRVVAPQTADSAAFDARQRYRIYRYRTGSRPLELLSMLVMFIRALMGTRPTYTLASIWFPAGIVGTLVPRLFRGPLGILAHGAEIAPRRGGIRRLVMRTVFEYCDCVFPNSGFTRDLLKSVGVCRKVTVVHCGVDSRNQVIRNPDPLRQTLLSVGRLVPRKGFDKVIVAVSRLRERFPLIRYEIIGDGPDRAKLEALVDSLGIGSLVVFNGAMDDAELSVAYGRADCFVLPVRSEGDDVEGFGIVYLEAAAAGVPVIGGRESGAEEAIEAGSTGFVVDGRDVDEIVEAIAKVLADPDLAKEFGTRGRQRALSAFTWDLTAARIDRAMKDSLRQTRR